MAATKKIEAKTTFYKDKSGDWRWQITKGSKIIGASTEGYKNRIECRENYFEISVETSEVIANSLKEKYSGIANDFSNRLLPLDDIRSFFSKAK